MKSPLPNNGKRSLLLRKTRQNNSALYPGETPLKNFPRCEFHQIWTRKLLNISFSSYRPTCLAQAKRSAFNNAPKKQNHCKPGFMFTSIEQEFFGDKAKCWVSSRMHSEALIDDGVMSELSSRAQCGVFPLFIVVWQGRVLENPRRFCVQINRTLTRGTVTAYSACNVLCQPDTTSKKGVE